MSALPIRVAVLGSGAGTNARALIEHGLKPGASYRVELVISTRPEAGIIRVAQHFDVPICVLPPSDWEGALVTTLEAHGIGILALAGFMRKLPPLVISNLSGRVINIHPALLPNHGGQGMYGIHVHNAVIAAGDPVSGATVHLVTEEYDEGAVLSQASVEVFPGDTAADLQERVKHLEHILYPRALQAFAERVQQGGGTDHLRGRC